MARRGRGVVILRYILDGHRPKPEPDLLTWGRWMETADRRVAFAEHELFRVSTVFLGLDYQFGKGPPLLFETMAFFNEGEGRERFNDFDQARYSTWEDAELGHKAMLKRCLKWARAAAEAKPAKRERT